MKKKSIAVLFPGQGSQFIGMGKEFLEADPEAEKLMDDALLLLESHWGATLRS